MDEIKQEQIVNRTVVVIDVLRASSTIVTALAEGCPEIVPVETIGQALALRGDGVILAGERLGKPVPDFHLPNSPTAVRQANLQGKRLVLTTTNGTRAIHRAERAEALFIGCFLNATSCIQAALAQKRDVTLYCAGTRRGFSQEDALAAGCLAILARRIRPDATLCDLGEVCAAAFSHVQDSLGNQLLLTAAGRRLAAAGSADDVLFAGRIDRYPLVPEVKDGRIQAPPVS